MAEPVFPTSMRDYPGTNKRCRRQAITEAQQRETAGSQWAGRHSTDFVEVV